MHCSIVRYIRCSPTNYEAILANILKYSQIFNIFIYKNRDYYSHEFASTASAKRSPMTNLARENASSMSPALSGADICVWLFDSTLASAIQFCLLYCTR